MPNQKEFALKRVEQEGTHCTDETSYQPPLIYKLKIAMDSLAKRMLKLCVLVLEASTVVVSMYFIIFYQSSIHNFKLLTGAMQIKMSTFGSGSVSF